MTFVIVNVGAWPWRARHGEVPGEIQVAALDLRLLQRLEDALEVLAALLDRLDPGGDVVAIEAEALRGRDLLTGLRVARDLGARTVLMVDKTGVQ